MAKRNPHAVEAVLSLIALSLVVGAAVVGFLVGRASAGDEAPSGLAATAPEGHSGSGLPARAFGDPENGARLFVAKRCADCHSFAGKGGTDAPPLDFMRGHLSAREVANMSGDIWNHLPAMLEHFEEEGIPVPTFSDDEMADLVAYLHSSGEAPAATGATTATTTH